MVFSVTTKNGFRNAVHGQKMSSMTLPLSVFRTRATSLLRDYAELTKLRVTTLIVMTAWCGYFFGAHQAGTLIGWIKYGYSWVPTLFFRVRGAG